MGIKDIAHEALHVSSFIFSDIGVKGDFTMMRHKLIW